jgi:alkylation response protein AidB-like acyl-CoA dehydrogenase
MDFGWASEEAQLYERAFAFARENLNDTKASRAFSRELWQRCGKFGFLGLSAPAAHGGLELGALGTAHVLEALGRGCNDMGLVFSVCAHLLACVMPIVEAGTPEQHERFLPKLVSGEWVGANAITEAEAGSDVFSLKARAVRDGDHYVLDGVKSFVTNGPAADVFVVYASTAPAHGYMGISAFIIERGVPGLVVGKPFEKIGLHSAPMSPLYMEACRVPVACRLGAEGEGAATFKGSMAWERACLFAAYVGSMDRQLAETVEFAKSRRQFGRPIGKHQAVSHRIAGMVERLEAARLLVYRACWQKDRGEDAGAAIALAKLAVSEASVQSSLDAIQIHGGLGVTNEGRVEQALRDAVPSTLFSGTSEIQREIVARSLGL